MNSGIIDSSVLIDCLRGRIEAITFLSFTKTKGPATTHVIVAAELLAGARDKREQTMLESFLKRFQILSPDELDALAALELFRNFHLSHGVDWPDCQIAATAIRLGAEVYSKHQTFFGVPRA
jgi:hypothetical protein